MRIGAKCMRIGRQKECLFLVCELDFTPRTVLWCIWSCWQSTEGVLLIGQLGKKGIQHLYVSIFYFQNLNKSQCSNCEMLLLRQSLVRWLSLGKSLKPQIESIYEGRDLVRFHQKSLQNLPWILPRDCSSTQKCWGNHEKNAKKAVTYLGCLSIEARSYLGLHASKISRCIEKVGIASPKRIKCSDGYFMELFQWKMKRRYSRVSL